VAQERFFKVLFIRLITKYMFKLPLAK